jgi:hypothetical protein
LTRVRSSEDFKSYLKTIEYIPPKAIEVKTFHVENLNNFKRKYNGNVKEKTLTSFISTKLTQASSTNSTFQMQNQENYGFSECMKNQFISTLKHSEKLGRNGL